MFWMFAYLFVIVTLLWLVKSFFRQRDLPHGPFKLPFIGNILTFVKNPNEKLNLLTQTYGPVFTLWFGRVPFIIVNDYYTAKEVLKKNDKTFSKRSDLFPDSLTRDKTRLTFMNYCPAFKQNKDLAKDILNSENKFLNVCTTNMMHLLIEDFEQVSEENEYDPSNMINQRAMDLLSNIIYGQKIDAKFDDFTVTNKLKVGMVFSVIKLLPWTKLFYWKSESKLTQFLMNRESILCEAFFSIYKNEHPNQCLATVIIDSLASKTSIERHDFAEKLCSDLYISGLDSLTSTIKWLLLYLITWPEIQETIFVDLKNKFERNKVISIDDAMCIPYLQAAVYESIRLSSVIPLSLPNITTESVTLKGYKLPKGTCVCINFSAIHHSSKYWNKPYEFNPSRFLTVNAEGKQQLCDGDSITGYLGFGSGLRKCVGSDLAMKLLVTVIANLIFNFQFQVTPWACKSNIVGKSSLMYAPNPYHIKAIAR